MILVVRRAVHAPAVLPRMPSKLRCRSRMPTRTAPWWGWRAPNSRQMPTLPLGGSTRPWTFELRRRRSDLATPRCQRRRGKTRIQRPLPRAKRPTRSVDTTTSAPKWERDWDRRVPPAATRPAQAADTVGSPAKTQRDVDSRASAAPKRSTQPTGSTTSPTKRQHEQVRGASFPAHGSARPSCNTTSVSKAGARACRAIPAAVKREIWQRDGGRCRIVDPRPGAAVHHGICCRSITGSRMPWAAVRSQITSGCCAQPTTVTPRGTGFTARVGRVTVMDEPREQELGRSARCRRLPKSMPRSPMAERRCYSEPRPGTDQGEVGRTRGLASRRGGRYTEMARGDRWR